MVWGPLPLRAAALLACAVAAGALTAPLVRRRDASSAASVRTAVQDKSKKLGGSAVFVAGIDGTMHRFWYKVHEACIVTGKCAQMTNKLADAMWRQRDNVYALEDAWKDQNLSYTAKRLILMRNDLMLTYPSGNPRGVAEYYFNPRLDNYFLAAAANADQLRIIVMVRRAADALVEAMMHGHFAKHLAWGARALNQQLIALPPDASFMCVGVHEVPRLGLTFARFFGEGYRGPFLGPFFNYTRQIHQMWPGALVRPCPKGYNCTDPELEEAVAMTRQICSHRQRDAPHAAGLSRTEEQRAGEVLRFVLG